MTSEEQARPGEGLDLRLDWSSADAVETKVLNQVLVQLGNPAVGQPDGLYLLLGEAAPPVTPGDTDEERIEALERYDGKLPVNVHGRYFVSRARLAELLAVLQQVAQQYDGLVEGGQHDGGRRNA